MSNKYSSGIMYSNLGDLTVAYNPNNFLWEVYEPGSPMVLFAHARMSEAMAYARLKVRYRKVSRRNWLGTILAACLIIGVAIVLIFSFVELYARLTT